MYLALGKSKLALQDFDKVLQLKSDFTAARLQRAKVLWKQADFSRAEHEFLEVLWIDQNNAEATASLEDIASLKHDYELAQDLVKGDRYEDAVDLLTRLIEFSPWASELRDMRAECYVAIQEYMSAVSDMRASAKLLSDNTLGYFKLATLLYRLGLVDEAQKEIRECLKLDPEHKDCFPLFKKLKNVAKKLHSCEESEKSGHFKDCISSAESVLKLEPHIENVRFSAHHQLCKCYVADAEASDPKLAIKHCQDALNVRREPSVLCDSAEAYLNAELFDDAIRDVKDAMEMDSGYQRAKELLQKAQQRQKMSESRDYYKILSVPRTATKQQIVKAYRKAAQKWHPDNFRDGEEKKRAEKKFIDIAAAKEVLTDEEKRAKFDRGEDPLDPESGKHSGFNPFQEFHQFHGSPFQFKFHFN